jgi:hypothetical protein
VRQRGNESWLNVIYRKGNPSDVEMPCFPHTVLHNNIVNVAGEERAKKGRRKGSRDAKGSLFPFLSDVVSGLLTRFIRCTR